MSTLHRSPVFIKIVSAIFIIVCTIFTAKAYDPHADAFNDVYIIINNTNATVGEIFNLVEKQTSFSFVYDENDINISKEIKLAKGQQLLKDVLNNISKQSGLHFIEKQNIILVNPGRGIVKNAEFRMTTTSATGVVTDASGTPLEGVSISVKGTRVTV